MSSLISTLLISLASAADPAPAPSAPPVDVDKVCAKARAQDEANKNNPKYEQTEVNAKCSEIYVSNLSKRMSEKLAYMKTPIIGICGVASGICASGKANQKIKTIGEKLAGVCGTMGHISGMAESVAEHQLEEKTNKETGAYDYKSAFGDALGIVSSGKDMASTFADGQDPTTEIKNDDGTVTKRDAAKEKKVACGTIAKEALTQSAEMGKHLETKGKMEDMENKQKKELAYLLSQGGSFSTEKFQSEFDADADVPPLDEIPLGLPEFPPELTGPFEELSGMKMDDVLANGANPSDIMNAMMGGLGLPPTDVAAAMALANALPTADLATNSDSKSSTGLTATSDTFSIPSMDDLLKGMMPQREPAEQKGNTLKAKDISKMTASEFEKDTKHSIFERVSLRYHKQTGRLEKLPWTGKFNVSANPKPIDALTNRFPASKMN